MNKIMLDGFEQRDENLKQLGFGDYEKYLNSDLWGWVRKQFYKTRLPADTYRRHRSKSCFLCNSVANLNLHHTEYSTQTLVGNFLYLNSLMVLCLKCHCGVHEGTRSLNEANFKLKMYHVDDVDFNELESVGGEALLLMERYQFNGRHPLDWVSLADMQYRRSWEETNDEKLSEDVVMIDCSYMKKHDNRD